MDEEHKTTNKTTDTIFKLNYNNFKFKILVDLFSYYQPNKISSVPGIA